MIFLLEDDPSIRELVVYALGESGLPCRGFSVPSELYAGLEEETPELLLLDSMLPEEDGCSVLRRLRASSRTADLPIIMLTARDSEFDKVQALNLGADDYVTKPFGITELGARIRAVLRRTKHDTKEAALTCGPLRLSVTRHSVTVSGVQIALTLKEFELLAYLLQNRGIVLSRDRILSSVWGYEFDGENRTVDVHVRTLRAKLGECGELIETVRGVGYRID